MLVPIRHPSYDQLFHVSIKRAAVPTPFWQRRELSRIILDEENPTLAINKG
jgi:hypothetical protein